MEDRPGTLATFFESIPMEIQKQGEFAYWAHEATSGVLRRILVDASFGVGVDWLQGALNDFCLFDLD